MPRNKRERSKGKLSQSEKDEEFSQNEEDGESSQIERERKSGSSAKNEDSLQREKRKKIKANTTESGSEESVTPIKTKEVRNSKRERPKSTEALNNNQQEKKIKLNADLSDTYVKFAKSLLLGDTTSVDEIVKANQEGVKNISTALNAYVKNALNVLRKEDDKGIDLGPESKYGRILRRSVQAILDKYGPEIDKVAAVQGDYQARDILNNVVKLYHPTEKWEENKNNENRETAKLAAEHIMYDYDVKIVRNKIESVKNSYHKGNSDSAIIEAYASAIADKGEDELIQGLAETRLRYSPITYGSKIYLAAKVAKPSETKEWEIFNSLIHEALHSIEHPDFTSFLGKYIPPGLQVFIKEGIVEYLTNQIWIDVLNNLAPAKSPNKNTPSQDFDKPLKINPAAKKKYTAEFSEYPSQMNTVKMLIDELERGKKGNGKKRLISAYFGGNLGAFLPKLNDM